MGWMNLPNAMTLARVLLVPVVVVLMHYDGPGPARLAAIIFVVACATDLVDGWLARRMGVTSTFGAFLDPLADKLMVMAILVMLVPLDRVPGWLVVILLSRELAITGLRGIAGSQGMIIKASNLGKFKTAYQMTALTFLLLHYPTLGIDTNLVGTWLIFISTGVSLYSGFDYMRAFVRYSKSLDSAPGAAT